jgi:SAM-dependent methyltransferase
MVIHSKCPLCSSGKTAFHLRCTDHLVSRKEFELYRCPECGFVFTQGYPDGEEIGPYYESDEYIPHDDSAEGFLNRLYLIARNIMLKKKKRLVESYAGNKKSKILDIGCGTGYFAATMKKSGWEATGIEPNSKAREFAVSRFGLDVKDPVHLPELANGSLDFITMWHVLEHLHDPFNYSKEIRRLLKQDGYCIIALPNCSSSDAAHYGREWAAYDVPRHLWHFNPATVKLFWEKEGFKITGIKRLSLDVFYISILSEKNLSSPIPFLRGATKGLWFALESAFNKSKSSSLIYILKRSDFQ